MSSQEMRRSPARLLITLSVLLLRLSLPAIASETLQGVRFDILSSINSGSAVATHTAFDIGDIASVFDGNTNSLARTPNISPAFVQVAYNQPRTLRKFRLMCSYGSNYDWSVEKADTQADMDAHTGTYKLLVPTRNFTSGTWEQYSLASSVTAKLFRVNVRRYGGDNYCHINEIEFYGDVVIDQINVTPASVSLIMGATKQFSAAGHNNTFNENYDVTSAVTWTATGNVGTLTATGLFAAQNAGTGTVTATLNSLVSSPAIITVEAANTLSDIDALYIERTPRRAFNPNDLTYSSGQYSIGQTVTYLAHVKNWGTQPVTFTYNWTLDSMVPVSGTVTVNAGQEITVPYPFLWDAQTHNLAFEAVTNASTLELSRLNNKLTIRTNALLVGMWVEDSLYRYMHQQQYKINDGMNGFEDWGQRMMRRWNEWFAKAIFPWSPNGILDRVALDKMTVVPDGALPLHGGLPTNNPDTTDNTVDLMWGYPWHPDDINPGAFYGFRWNGPFLNDFGSIHEMNHARFHTDLYAIDINEPTPTAPQKVLLTDDGGNFIANTSYMPYIYFDQEYYNKWRDIMGAGANFMDGYTAGVWNWKAFRRGRGNQNAPPDFEVFTGDLPTVNNVRFIDQNGIPLAGAQVSVYQSINEVFDKTADYTRTADANGTISLPKNPFGGSKPSAYTNANVIFKVRYRNQLYFMFQEFTDFNIQYWLGNTQAGNLTREIDLRDNPTVVPQNAWLGNYFQGTNFQTFVTARQDNSINFSWVGSPAPGVNASNYSVYWQGGIVFTEGWKTFTITSDGGVQLLIDGRLVFDQSNNATLQTWKPVIYTMSDSPFVNPGHAAANGAYHRVEVRYSHTTGPAQIAIAYTDEDLSLVPIPADAWRADYFSTKTLNGYITSRLETAINNDYVDGSPDPGIGGDNFSARWQGNWNLLAGTYSFMATTDDGMRVWLDGSLVLNHWQAQPATTYTFSKTFATAGSHLIKVEYYDGGGQATAKFGWVRILPNVTVSGLVTLESCVAPSGQAVTLEFRPTDGSTSFVRNVTLGAGGAFTVSSIPGRPYNLAIKGSKWLQSVVAIDASNGGVSGVSAFLPAGDADNNNLVDIADFGLLVTSYGGDVNIPGSGYDVRADFNCDGLVDVGDFGLLVNNYNDAGAP